MEKELQRNIFILTDLEGVAGVTEFAQTREIGSRKDDAMVLLTKELNAIIEGINEFNADIKIHIWDGHGSGGIVKEKLLPIENYIPPQRIHMINYFREHNIGALLFVGQHAMANTPNGNLCHTMSSRTIEYYKLNDEFVGEFGLRAAIAGEIDVPTIFISGDDKACEEAKKLIPDIITAVVKEGTGLESAISLSFEEVYSLLKQKVKIALEDIDKILPYKISYPIIVEKKKKKGNFPTNFLKRCAKLIGFRAVRYRGKSLEELEDKKVI